MNKLQKQMKETINEIISFFNISFEEGEELHDTQYLIQLIEGFCGKNEIDLMDFASTVANNVSDFRDPEILDEDIQSISKTENGRELTANELKVVQFIISKWEEE